MPPFYAPQTMNAHNAHYISRLTELSKTHVFTAQSLFADHQANLMRPFVRNSSLN